MPLLFNRTVRLNVFAGNTQITLAKPGAQSFDIEFDIWASLDKEPNTAKIIIYNLSETTRNVLSGGHQGVEFFAGYGEDEPPLIFRGATTNVTHDHQRPDSSDTCGHRNSDGAAK
jgi:hypothetical protein